MTKKVHLFVVSDKGESSDSRQRAAEIEWARAEAERLSLELTDATEKLLTSEAKRLGISRERMKVWAIERWAERLRFPTWSRLDSPPEGATLEEQIILARASQIEARLHSAKLALHGGSHPAEPFATLEGNPRTHAQHLRYIDKMSTLSRKLDAEVASGIEPGGDLTVDDKKAQALWCLAEMVEEAFRRNRPDQGGDVFLSFCVEFPEYMEGALKFFGGSEAAFQAANEAISAWGMKGQPRKGKPPKWIAFHRLAESFGLELKYLNPKSAAKNYKAGWEKHRSTRKGIGKPARK